MVGHGVRCRWPPGVRPLPDPRLPISPRTHGLAPLLILIAAAACSRTAPPPEAGFVRGGLPELRGQRVLVLPPQLIRGGHSDLERELVYALQTRGPSVGWILPDELRKRVLQTPGFGADLDRLPIRSFTLGEVERIGDPLFGALYRLGAMTDADLALLPVEVRERAGEEEGVVVEVVSALVHIRSGRVLWFAIVDGAPGPVGDLAATASTLDALARRLAR